MLMFPAAALPRFARPAAAAIGTLRRFGRWWLACRLRAEQRARLAELDERMLKDVGISPRAAAEESAKPWWRG